MAAASGGQATGNAAAATKERRRVHKASAPAVSAPPGKRGPAAVACGVGPALRLLASPQVTVGATECHRPCWPMQSERHAAAR